MIEELLFWGFVAILARIGMTVKINSTSDAIFGILDTFLFILAGFMFGNYYFNWGWFE